LAFLKRIWGRLENKWRVNLNNHHKKGVTKIITKSKEGPRKVPYSGEG